MGDNTANYSKAKSVYAPDEKGFVKTDLVTGTFFEPTELTVLPDLDVLVAQRRGEIYYYNNQSKKVKQVGFLNVYHKTNAPGVNAEEGLLGMQADPDFEKNHHVFIFYSPADKSVNRLSRFTFENDTILNSSEKVVLEFFSQRDICCHTGGSIAFGPDKTLFVSTGDNTTPFDEPNQKYELSIGDFLISINGWNFVEASSTPILEGFPQREIAMIGLRFKSTTDIPNFEINIGEVYTSEVLLSTNSQLKINNYVTVSYPENGNNSILFNINWPNSNQLKYTVTDLQGKIVAENNIAIKNTTAYSFPINGLAKGTYVVKFSDESNRNEVQKIIIK
jgi:hypothetical protein